MATNVAQMPEPELVVEGETPTLKLSARGEERMNSKAAIVEAIAQAILAETEKKGATGSETEAANRLMQVSAIALVEGHITKDELSSMLGAQYGFKETSKGEQSKTPDGTGNSHRKRIVLLADAARIATDETLPESDWPKALQGCNREDIAQIATQCLETGELTPSSAYNKLTKLKPKNPPKAIWEDTDKLGKLIKALSDDVTCNTIRQNEGLREAFARIRDLAIAAQFGECRALAEG